MLYTRQGNEQKGTIRNDKGDEADVLIWRRQSATTSFTGVISGDGDGVVSTLVGDNDCLPGLSLLLDRTGAVRILFGSCRSSCSSSKSLDSPEDCAKSSSKVYLAGLMLCLGRSRRVVMSCSATIWRSRALSFRWRCRSASSTKGMMCSLSCLDKSRSARFSCDSVSVNRCSPSRSRHTVSHWHFLADIFSRHSQAASTERC